MNRKPTILIDLDGTLLDSSRRLYKLFCYLAPESKLTLEEYWSAKRIPKSNDVLLKEFTTFEPHQIERFKREWLKLIETPDLLSLDRLHDRALEGLQSLESSFSLLLITARQSLSNAREQLERLEVAKYFSKVLVTGGRRTKLQTIKENMISIPAGSVSVGDTAEDIALGRSLGVRTAVVENGFRCAQYLKLNNPDELYADFFLFAEHTSRMRNVAQPNENIR